MPEGDPLLEDALDVVFEVLDGVLEDVDERLRPVLRVHGRAGPRRRRQPLEVGRHLLALHLEQPQVELEVALVVAQRSR